MIAAWPRWLTSRGGAKPGNNPTTTRRQQPGDNLQPTYAHTHTCLYSSWSASARAFWPLTLASEAEPEPEPEPGPGSVCLQQISAENHFNCAQFVAIVGASHTVPWWECLCMCMCVRDCCVCVCLCGCCSHSNLILFSSNDLAAWPSIARPGSQQLIDSFAHTNTRTLTHTHRRHLHTLRVSWESSSSSSSNRQATIAEEARPPNWFACPNYSSRRPLRTPSCLPACLSTFPACPPP